MYIIHVQSISLYNHINLPRTRLSVHVESFLICSISCTSFSSVVDMVLLGASFSLQNSNKANNVKSSKIIHFAGVFNWVNQVTSFGHVKMWETSLKVIRLTI